MTYPQRHSPSNNTSLPARLSLLLVSVAVALPSPWAPLWGGRDAGSVLSVLVMAAAWAAFLAWGHGQRRQRASQETRNGLFLLGDVLALSVLLFESGAAQNPFTMLYFVPITLATVMAPAWTGRIALASVVAFAGLLWRTSSILAPHKNHPHHAHFFHHVQGMAIALAVAGAFITFFVLRFARSLRDSSQEIQQLRINQQQDRFAVALGALSAGAAHELGTPLATLQLLAEEFQYMDASEQKEAASTMVEAVQRMKGIVHNMSSSELSAAVLGDRSLWDPRLLQSELQEATAIRFVASSVELTDQPQGTLRQIVRELLRNAQRAANSSVELHVTTTEAQLLIEVLDDGPGIAPEQLEHVADPFVSHTGGSGLGLFLASVHARQLGGHLQLDNRTPHGLHARLQLPRLLPSYRRPSTPSASPSA